MPEIGNVLLVLATLVPLVAAALRPGRAIAVTASATSTALVAAAALPYLLPGHAEPNLFLFSSRHASLFHADAMSALPMLLYALLVTGVLVSSPRSDTEASGPAGTLILLSGTLATYAARHPVVLFLGWTVAAVPFLMRMWPGQSSAPARPRLPLIALGSSIILLGAGLALAYGMRADGPLAFTLIVLAALIRKGLFPFHTWVVAAFADGPLLPSGLLVNAHLGAYVIARVAIAGMPDLSRDALTLVSNVALISALYSAFAGLGERNPRRSLALLMISQSSFILAGLESRSAEGIAGALTFWIVVSVAIMGLLIVYRALEKRIADLHSMQFGGLASAAPRLACFFAICGLSLVGLPGTMGFAAEDLLFQGALSGHPLLGITLPLATALNAVNVFRLFCSIFFGRAATAVPVFPDALRRERLVLTAVALALIAGGIAPRWVIASCVPSAESIATVLARPASPHVSR